MKVECRVAGCLGGVINRYAGHNEDYPCGCYSGHKYECDECAGEVPDPDTESDIHLCDECKPPVCSMCEEEVEETLEGICSECQKSIANL